jgi:hypothetical protein
MSSDLEKYGLLQTKISLMSINAIVSQLPPTGLIFSTIVMPSFLEFDHNVDDLEGILIYTTSIREQILGNFL